MSIREALVLVIIRFVSLEVVQMHDGVGSMAAAAVAVASGSSGRSM